MDGFCFTAFVGEWPELWLAFDVPQLMLVYSDPQ